MFQTFQHINPALQGKPLGDHVAAIIPPAALLDIDLQEHAGFYAKVRVLLARSGAQTAPHGLQRNANHLFENLFINTSKKNFALDFSREFISCVKVWTPLRAEESKKSQNRKLHKRTAHNATTRFKNSDAKFNGDFKLFWNVYVDAYS